MAQSRVTDREAPNSSTMATDSTLEETDASPDEGRDETGARGTPIPPRPPRPGKRSKGSGRIPIPLPQSRPDFEAVEGDALDRAPAVNIDEREGSGFPLVASRSRPGSLPEESFADIDADLADHAPAAPVTPWRSGPAPAAAPSEATPPRGTPLNFSSDDEERVSEPEPTIVGKVSENLLELSSAGGDENTRAFTAPRELIELARRKREERQHGVYGDELGRATARPPEGASAHEAVNLRAPAPPNVRVDSVVLSDRDSDAAPPVERTKATELDHATRPPTASRAMPESGPEIEIDPASELSPSARRAVLASTGRNLPVSEEPVASVKKPPQRAWLLMFVLFVVMGVIIARWRDIAALLR